MRFWLDGRFLKLKLNPYTNLGVFIQVYPTGLLSTLNDPTRVLTSVYSFKYTNWFIIHIERSNIFWVLLRDNNTSKARLLATTDTAAFELVGLVVCSHGLDSIANQIISGGFCA